MKAYAIVIKGNEISEKGYEKLLESYLKYYHDFGLYKFDATTPETVKEEMEYRHIKWNYPWEGEVVDFRTGLTKKAYPTKNHEARIACAMSHLRLWSECTKLGEPIIILEHDAVFVKKVDFQPEDTGYDIVGINNPIGCTRKSKVYRDKILEKTQPFQLAPYIDDDMKYPQGLAGNSAYMVKPSGASKLIRLVHEHGLWPNDAIMCRQLVDIAVTRKFYTTVQGLKSTTTV